MKKVLIILSSVFLSQLALAGTGAKLKISYKADGSAQESSCKISSEEIDKVKASGTGSVCSDLISKTDKKEITMTQLSEINGKLKICYIGQNAAGDKAGLVEIVNKWAGFMDGKDSGWKVSQGAVSDKAVLVKLEKGTSGFELAIDLTCAQPAAK